MKILELFSGTESFSKVARERGHQTFTVELDRSFNPDLCKDILDLTAKEITCLFGEPDIIWASPPCTFFSVASIGKHWNLDHTPKTEDAKRGIELVKKTMQLIKDLNPKFIIIENPRGKLRKLNLIPYERHTVTYCQYGDTRMKPTDVWVNFNWKSKPICSNGDSCHTSAPRGSRTGTQGLKGNKERSVVPRELCLEIIKCCEEFASTHETETGGKE